MNVGNTSVNILKRGVELEERKRYTEALVCYNEGLRSLVYRMEVEQHQITKAYLLRKIGEYKDRAETVKRLVVQQKEDGQFHEKLVIENNSTGHSYMALFGRFLDEDVKSVRVEDPYVRSFHQCQNFLRLCELLVRLCVNLRDIKLVTMSDLKSSDTQKEWFGNIAVDLDKYNMKLHIEYSDLLRDRQILLSTGFKIKIGRGLDIYKPPANRFCIGVYDLDLRPCHQTTVEIVQFQDAI